MGWLFVEIIGVVTALEGVIAGAAVTLPSTVPLPLIKPSSPLKRGCVPGTPESEKTAESLSFVIEACAVAQKLL